MKFSCNIKSYGLTAIEANNASDFRQLKYVYPPISNIPMMQARRMSIATKLACELYIQISKEINFDYALFLSAHGEIERSFKVINDILQSNIISPTDFSMSVHNAASGISSIMSQNQCETTSIAGGHEGFITVFHEIIASFIAGKKRVILIAFDGEMPEFYQKYGALDQSAYAVALIIERGHDFLLSLHNHQEKKQKSDLTIPRSKMPLPLQFWQKWQKEHSNLSKESHFIKPIEIRGNNQTLSLQKVL